MDALNEQMQKPEVQEQMKEVQSLMQDKDFAEKVESLRVSDYMMLLLNRMPCMYMSYACTGWVMHSSHI